MSFANIAIGSPFYILKRANKPTLEIGIVKSKVDKPPYRQQTSIPLAFAGTNIPQNVSFTVDINGKEVQTPDLPGNIEIANDKDGCLYSGNRETMLQAVDDMLQSSKKALEQVDYHKGVLAEGEKILEALNPKYAEEKEQARRIKALEDGQVETKKMLETILSAINTKNSDKK